MSESRRMSIRRASAKAGWVMPGALPRGPGGRPCCRQCGSEVPKGRRTFCGPECVEAWRLKTDPGFVRQAVRRRDGGVCALCGAKGPWQADHIVPVVEGGGECDLDNYRTLCIPCHRTVTADLHRRLAERRRRQREGRWRLCGACPRFRRWLRARSRQPEARAFERWLKTHAVAAQLALTPA